MGNAEGIWNTPFGVLRGGLGAEKITHQGVALSYGHLDMTMSHKDDYKSGRAMTLS